MKILLAYGSYLPLTGGVWTYVKQLTKGLEGQGHDVDILALHPDDNCYYLLKKGTSFNKNPLERTIYKKLKEYFEKKTFGIDDWIIRKESKRHSLEIAAFHLGISTYDLIHAQDVVTAHALSRVKSITTPLVCTIHSSMIQEIFLAEIKKNPQITNSQRWKYISQLETLGPNSSDLSILPSNWLKDQMEHYSIQSEMTVIPYGIDIPDFQRQQTKLTDIIIPEEKKIIACSARLVFEKGQFSLLQALEKLKKVRNDWICLFIGDSYKWDDFGDFLKTEVKRKNLSNNVIFLGKRDDVPALLTSVDVFVLPSLLENLPFVIIEAQIAGKPIVASDAGGVPEMIEHGETGLLYPRDNSDELCDRLEKILSDGKLRKNLAEKAKNFGLTAWHHTKMIDSTLEVYNKVRTFPNDHRSIEEGPLVKDNLGILKKHSLKMPRNYHIPDSSTINALLDK
ncbi:glycosyltransferase family 4 protein [Robertmurraya sp.]|jgi:glycosyltransferase involved in cell wall biosynthesis|uniref:glycosyltransferase family 4 protein n=1 Tax=Robertmurraya sp. TaxID=2837525 RepID=UPI003703D670